MTNYKSWDIYTEIDYISLFIKTYLALISTVKNITNKQDESSAMNSYLQHPSFKTLLSFNEQQDFDNIKQLYLTSKEIFEKLGKEDYLFSNFYSINEDFSDSMTKNDIKFKDWRKNANIHWIFSWVYRWNKIEFKFKSEKVVYSSQETIFGENIPFVIKIDNIKSSKLYIKENFLEYLRNKKFYDTFLLTYNWTPVKIFIEQEMRDYLDRIFLDIFPCKPFNQFEDKTSFNSTEENDVKNWLTAILKDIRNLVIHAHIDPLDENTKKLYKYWYNILRKFLENNIKYLENNSPTDADT